MIASLKGTVQKIRKDALILEVGGIGFEVVMGKCERYRMGQELFVWTYLQSREDGQTLFGFETETEYDLFVSLIRIKGIGPKTAVNMLAALPAAEMAKAIELGDLKTLKSLPGIGAKTASQIILDLKGKIVVEENESGASEQLCSSNPVWNEAAEALESLGYKPVQIAFIEKEMSERTDLNVNEMIRISLKKLAAAAGF